MSRLVSSLVSSNEQGITHVIVVEKIGPGNADDDYLSRVLTPSDPDYPDVAREMASRCHDPVLAAQLLDAIKTPS
jgi:hypothetical protein